jgi:membrane protein
MLKDRAERFSKTLFQAVKDFMHDSGPQWAAAIAYYSLLSAFPLLLAIASIAAFFVDPQWAIEQATSFLDEFLPQGAGQVESVVQGAIEARGSVSVLSILSLLWTGSRVFGVVTKALNIAFDVEETYSFFKRILVELAMLLTVGLLFILALSSGPILGLLASVIQVLPAEGFIYQLITEIIPAVLLLLAFFLTYRFIPRRNVDWRAALLGAGLATILFVVARPLFSFYLGRFANYNLIYGSLAIVIILVLWAWIVSAILLLGGEVVSHVQRMILEGKTPEEVEQQHLKRAPTHRVPAEE